MVANMSETIVSTGIGSESFGLSSAALPEPEPVPISTILLMKSDEDWLMERG